MRRKNINNLIAVLLFLLLITIAAYQLFLLPGRSGSISYLKSFPERTNVNDAPCVNGIGTADHIHNKVFTTIQLPK
jgi:hypothetical protein